MRILVCGGRNYNNYLEVENTLDHYTNGGDVIIHGAARGADSLADRYAVQEGLEREIYKPDWDRLGKAAGAIRNRQMLTEGKPDLVIAFPGGVGTAHMVTIAKQAGIEVIEIKGP